MGIPVKYPEKKVNVPFSNFLELECCCFKKYLHGKKSDFYCIMLLYLFKLHCCILRSHYAKKLFTELKWLFVIFHVSSEYKYLHLKPIFSTREGNSINAYREMDSIKPTKNLKSAQFQSTVDGSTEKYTFHCIHSYSRFFLNSSSYD